MKWLFIHCFRIKIIIIIIIIMEFAVVFQWSGFSSLVFVEGGKPENPEKNPRSRDENQYQTQPTFDRGFGNWTRATAEGGECSHHCACSLNWSQFLSPEMCYSHAMFIGIQQERSEIIIVMTSGGQKTDFNLNNIILTLSLYFFSKTFTSKCHLLVF